MNQVEILQDRFTRVGAKLRIEGFRTESRPVNNRRLGQRLLPFGIGVDPSTDVSGECFVLWHVIGQVEFDVVAIMPITHHLVLMAKTATPLEGTDGAIYDHFRFLCGRDEQHWFVAGVPAEANSVKAAIESLRPDVVRRTEERVCGQLSRIKRGVYRGYIRQGEWFLFLLRKSPLMSA